MGIVLFLIGMVVGCFIGFFLLALVLTGHDEDEVHDETDKDE